VTKGEEFMLRRTFLKSVGAGFALAAIGCNSTTNKKRPNIILCMADDQGWGDMAYNGHPVLKTPNFDDMAKTGLRFDRFYAAAPVCSPTRASVLTGRHPNRMGCFKWGHTLRPQEVTIAEVLKSKGYVTGHFGKWHLGSVQKSSPVNPGNSGFDEWLSAPNFFDNDPILSREGIAIQTQGESSEVIANAALEFIHKHYKGDSPIFTVVWFGSPHNPHRAIENDRILYADQPEKKRDFLGEITGMDRAFGKLRDELGKLGIRENTLLWYCSDNGGLPNLGSTGGRGDKGEIYEGGLRVPAILEWPPFVKTNRVTDTPCNTSDIYPTLVEIVGAAPKNQPPLDGISLVPLVHDKMKRRPQPMGFWSYPESGVSTPSAKWMAELLEAQKQGSEITVPSRLRMDAGEIKKQYPLDTFPGHSAWLDWPWKLHRIENKDGEIKFELYNLKNGPLEEKNVLDQETAKVGKMKKQLGEWLVSVVNSLNGKDYEV
jgi:arylsulfatase A-like enzyme